LIVNGSFAFNGGTLGITGPGGLTVGGGGLLGASVMLATGRSLHVAATTSIDAGSVFMLEPGGDFSSGNVSNQGEFILNGVTTIAATASFENAGLLRGNGKVTGVVSNLPGGVVRIAPGERLQFTGASFATSGFVEVIGTSAAYAEAHFAGLVANTGANGLIAGSNSLFRFQSGLTNQADFALSVGTNHVFGDVNNGAGGTILITGGAAVTFYDDIVQNGTFRVSKVGSTASFAVVLGSFTGSGGSTGGGDIFFEGDLRPGNSPARVTFENNVAFGSSATIEIELGGVNAGTQYDQIFVAGDLELGGTLQVSLINGFNPTAGQSFNIFDWLGIRTGTLSNISLPALVGLSWNTSQLYSMGVLSVSAGGLPGDYNENGTVDAADYTIWRNHFGQSSALPNDDTPGVGPDDYTRWKQHFGETGSGGGVFNGGSEITAVPESSSVLLFAVGVSGLFALCQKKRGCPAACATEHPLALN
jgi:hypothetical protein